MKENNDKDIFKEDFYMRLIEKKLNFGCGVKIKPKKNGWINVDIVKEVDVDKSFDFEKFPYPFEDNTFDYVYIDNVLEHLDNIPKVMDELWRICKNNAIIEIFVPYWNHSVAYNDPTHKHYFNTNVFEDLCNDDSPYNKLKPERKLELIKVKKIPGSIKRRIPLKILNFLDKFLHGMFIEINAKIKVKKIKLNQVKKIK